jgi:hypothetical protein
VQLPIYSPEDEQALMTKLWSSAIKDASRSLCAIRIPVGSEAHPLEHFKGPRRWQRNVLRQVKAHITKQRGTSD